MITKKFVRSECSLIINSKPDSHSPIYNVYAFIIFHKLRSTYSEKHDCSNIYKLSSLQNSD